MSGDFTLEQKRYLEGFASGLQVSRAGRAGVSPGAAPAANSSAAVVSGPDAAHLAAMARFEATGKKLSTRRNGSARSILSTPMRGSWTRLRATNIPSRRTISAGAIYGLFYVAPAQNIYMCRLRIPNGILTHWQFAGIADVAERYRRRLCPCHDARQPADPRDRGRRTRSTSSRPSRISASAPAAPAPTTSAT